MNCTDLNESQNEMLTEYLMYEVKKDGIKRACRGSYMARFSERFHVTGCVCANQKSAIRITYHNGKELLLSPEPINPFEIDGKFAEFNTLI